jgi:hypothetical protein
MILYKDLCTGKAKYIYISLRGQVYVHVIVILNYNNICRVSAVIVYPPFKASSCKLNNSNRNTEVEKKIDYIYPYPFNP